MRLFYSAVVYRAVAALLLMCWQAKPAEPVDWIVRAKYVVTMDAQRQVISEGAVAIRGTNIVGVGSQAEIAQRFQAKHTLDKPEALIAPGLIDTHTHAPMSLFRGIADDKRLHDWLTNYIFPLESKNVTADFVRWGTRLACLEMVLAGITTYTDMYYFEDVEAEAAKEAGVRGVLGETIIGFPAPDHKTWQEAIAATEKYIQRFHNDELIVPAVAPHAIYTTPDEALVASHLLAVKYGVPLVIHLAETQKERDDALTTRNHTPTQVLEQLGVLDGRVIAAHAIWEDDNDLQILKSHGTGVAHCPSSNMKLASGVARVTDMLKLGIPVGLGNDGFAGSNDSADLIREMDLAAKLQKVTRMDPTALPAEQAFEMATIGGARVLGMEKEIGSLEEGKRADLITISLANPNAVPNYNVYSQIVYAAKASDVEDVFINGKQIVSARRVLTLNQQEIYRKAAEYRRQILASLKQ
ncbi:MAG TPA: amidohydrolase [Bryobacteraceae bacterium]|jgi:5-methylthioadenosine/S-adenosylhomocysteine deaminase